MRTPLERALDRPALLCGSPHHLHRPHRTHTHTRARLAEPTSLSCSGDVSERGPCQLGSNARLRDAQPCRLPQLRDALCGSARLEARALQLVQLSQALLDRVHTAKHVWVPLYPNAERALRRVVLGGGTVRPSALSDSAP